MKTLIQTKKIAVLLSFLLVSFSQILMAGECYIKVESEEILPISENGDGGWTKSESFNGLLKKYGITKYYQAFPTAPTDWLQSIYVLEGDMSIMDELKTSYSKEISYVEEIERSEELTGGLNEIDQPKENAEYETFCYIKVESEEILPISENGDGGWTKSESFNGLLKKYGITKYYQAFPTAPTDWLQSIYVLEGDTLIAEELRAAFAKEISLVETNSTEFYSLTGIGDVYSQGEAFDLLPTQSQIGVRIPEGVRNSSLSLYDMSGVRLWSCEISQTGSFSIEINSSDLKSGVYCYILVCDGNVACVRKMALSD